jgi:uncharacterized membrane protein YeaQ/YmgE (transglycosylase-associated protein family)
VTLEYIVQMGPMLAFAGATVGWMAQIAPTTRGYGFLPDMTLGLVGSVVAGALAWSALSPNTGMLAMCVIGGVGAALAIFAQRSVWYPGRTEP